MYRTSSHEPRYKHSTRKARRHDASREASENSTSDEEEDSTESGTEESGDTLESRGSECIRKRSVYSADSSCHQRKQFNKQNVTSSFMTSHICHSNVIKHDKITQKNLLSPFPSFTIPPIYRELAGPPNRGRSARHSREGQTEDRRPPREMQRREESDDQEDDSVCCIHKPCERKGYDRYRGYKDHGAYKSRSNRSERILTCVNAGPNIEASPPPEKSPAKEPAPPVPARRPKTADVETATSIKCQESRVRSRRKSATGTAFSDVGLTLPSEAAAAQEKKSMKVAEGGSGEVKEKLVYVVEEKGKDTAKLETDLFTLNEILAIKKDLVELSEFAMKLKKLKETKRKAETGTNQQTACQCKTAAELLKDVNRRIEALESKQEELERAAGRKAEQKEDTETEWKKTTNDKKPSLDSQSKTPIEALKLKASAMMTPSFPKMEVSRTDNLSNNSDIVNELMDIKTQLHKLEQKRMSKGAQEDASAAEDLKLPRKEEHTIAVFSSKTYILTENFEKRKQDLKAIDEDKLNNYCSTMEEESRKEQMKEHVANWLKNVFPKNQESPYLPPSGWKRDENLKKETERKKDVKCKNCSQVLKVDDFQNQEPQKNRATDKDGRAESDLGFADARKNDRTGKQPSPLMKYRECIVTPCGKIFAYVNCSSGRISVDSPEQYRPKSAQPQPRSQGNEKTDVSGSIPSAVLAKECVQWTKVNLPKRRHYGGLLPRIINSKSVHEMSANSSKTEKTVRNTNRRNIDKMAQPKDKRHKDGKNQCLKLLEAHLMALRRTLKRSSTSSSFWRSTHSEFLASVNLDSGTMSETSRLQGSGDNKTMIMAYSATTKRGDIERDCIDDGRKRRTPREEEKRRKQREAECKKILKRKLKQQKKCESAERKRRREQKKQEKKQLKHRCKELSYGNAIEEYLAKKSRSVESYNLVKRSAESSTPKKSRSSQEFVSKKSHCPDGYVLRKSFSEDSLCRRKHRHLEEHSRKCYCEPVPGPKHRRCEEEHVPRKSRYGEEECDERYKTDIPRKSRYREEECDERFKTVVPRKSRYREEECDRRYKADVPRRHYEKEEVSKRQGEKEEVPRKYRYEEEEDFDRRYKEEVPRKNRYEEEDFDRRYKEEAARRHYGKEENPRRQRLEEDHIPKKLVCEEATTKPGHLFKEKQFSQEDYQRSSEDKSERSQYDKTADSWLLYRKRQEEQLRKMKYKISKQPSEGCKLKNVKKNLGLLKINMPLAGEFCNGKHPKCNKKKTPDKQRRDSEGLDDDKAPWDVSLFNYNEDEDEYDDEYRTHHRQDRNDRPQTDHQQLHYSHHHADRPDFMNNCRCVRVYLQTQAQRGWSGLGPFRKLSSDSATEVTSSRTAESCRSYKNNFGLPKARTSVFHVSCEDKDDKCLRKCNKKRDKCERKERKRRHKKHKKKCKDCRDDCECRCRNCGNIHRKGHHQESVRCRTPPPQAECCKQDSSVVNPKDPSVKCEPSSPLISFLSNFSKSHHPRDRKKAKFLRKLDEVRYLKMCATMGRKSGKRRDGSKSSQVSHKGDGKCRCSSKLTEIESRLSMLETTKDELMEKCCKKKHKKKEHKKRKKCCKSTDCENYCRGCRDCRKDCGSCQGKDCGNCQGKDCGKCQGKDCDNCQGKDCAECQRKETRERHRKKDSEHENKECRDCSKKESCDCMKKHKRKKKKSSHTECCHHSDSEESHSKKKKHKKRKKHKCCECDAGEHHSEPVEKSHEPVRKPCETAAYYHTVYSPSAVDSKNDSTLSITSKSSTVDEKESTESTKSKEEPPQKEQQMKEGLSSLHSFWKILRKYGITYSRSGMENLMKKIRGKKSSCTLDPDISMVDELSKDSPELRQVAEMEGSPRGKNKNKEDEMKGCKPCRKRHA